MMSKLTSHLGDSFFIPMLGRWEHMKKLVNQGIEVFLGVLTGINQHQFLVRVAVSHSTLLTQLLLLNPDAFLWASTASCRRFVGSVGHLLYSQY